jgi:hypothetical protein
MVAVWVVESECSCRRLLFRCFLFALGREEIGQPRQEQGEGLAHQRLTRRAVGTRWGNPVCGVIIGSGVVYAAVLAGHANSST